MYALTEDALNKELLYEIIPRVEKPARYTGGELNMTEKKDAEVKFCLCFPDVYEIGMSHLGSRILYHIINKRSDALCERAFAPWTDMDALMRENGLPMFSLENKREIGKFDIIGFSLLYEMCYTNILSMLELANIPFYAADRGGEFPLIIAGGPCACNPEPIAPFMDAIVVGDGEEVIGRIIDIYKAWKKSGEPKHSLLMELAKTEGVYIPSFYEPEYRDGTFDRLVKTEPSAPDKITKAMVKDLDAAEFIGKPIVPYMSIVHDRIALELFRGCTRGCRFCQAGFIYRPIRERRLDTLLNMAKELTDCTGYDEISLMSLSSGDYSRIHELVPEIIDTFRDKHVSVSLPSLRIDSFMKDDLEKMQSVRKSGLTLAPEAGTQRLRDVINKCVTEEDLLRSVHDAFEAGWTGVKLYFMLGLPTETDEDLMGIADLAKKVAREFYSVPKEKRGKGLRITVSVSTFVPKPFTPFQWEAQNDTEEVIRKQQLLKEALRGVKNVEYQYHAPYVSRLEAVFAKGDRRLADVLVSAYKKGARFDSWDECFKLSAYEEAFAENGLTVEQYANRRTDINANLPWEHIDMLVTKEYLKKEYERSLSEALTQDCREKCNGCFGKRCAESCTMNDGRHDRKTEEAE